MTQEELEMFFQIHQPYSTLTKVEKEKLIPSPKGNHERSLIGMKWFYYGETEDEYTLFHDEIVDEVGEFVFVDLYMDNTKMVETSVPIKIVDIQKRYPAQDLFPVPMEKEEAIEILREHFKNQ